MDHKSYKVNECAALVYLMEESQKATHILFNAKIYDEMVAKEKSTTKPIGYLGKLFLYLIFVLIYLQAFCHSPQKSFTMRNLGIQNEELGQKLRMPSPRRGMIFIAPFQMNFKLF